MSQPKPRLLTRNLTIVATPSSGNGWNATGTHDALQGQEYLTVYVIEILEIPLPAGSGTGAAPRGKKYKVKTKLFVPKDQDPAPPVRVQWEQEFNALSAGQYICIAHILDEAMVVDTAAKEFTIA